ncbi:MAG: GntR family transcriptional regulator [Chloroflexi bacterium]|nr:GntR family transcriptional regulator [Chloroflexota bacterium]
MFDMTLVTLDSIVIDRESPTPLYHQLEEALVQLLKSGAYAIGDLFPTEEELCGKFHVSRITVRRATEELVREGYLVARQGKGTFVAKPKIQRHMPKMKSFSEEMLDEGHQPGSRVLSLRHERACEDVASTLGLELNSWVWVAERLRLADEEPICLSLAYLSLPEHVTFTPTELENQVSLWTVLEGKGIRMARSDETIQAVAAGPREANLLHVELGSPLLLVEGTVYSDEDAPIEYHKIFNRGDRYTYSVRTSR